MAAHLAAGLAIECMLRTYLVRVAPDFDPSTVCFADSVNRAEVYYEFVRTKGEPSAKAANSSLFADGDIERRDMSRRFWQRVGNIPGCGTGARPNEVMM